MPDTPILGTIRDKEKGYEWLTWKKTMLRAKELAAGMERLGLVEEVEAEGKKWKFFGI